MDNSVLLKINALDNSKEAFKSLSRNLESVQKTTVTLRERVESLQPTFQKMSVVGGIAMTAIGGFIYKTTVSASDLAESMNAVNVVFGDSAGKILSFGETAARSVGLSNAAFNQLATNTGTVLSNTGKSMDEVADMTTELAVRAADLASVYNTDVETAMNAIRSALIGQSEPLRNLGVVMSEAQTKAFALATGIIEVDREMTEQEKTLARYQFIMAETTKQAGDFSNTSESLANQQRILSAELENISSTLGSEFIPVITSVLQALAPLLETLARWIQDNPELTRNIVLLTAALAGLVAIIGAVGIALLALNAPALIVIGVITAIGSIIYGLTNGLKAFGLTWTDVWEGIKTATSAAVDWILSQTLDPLIEKLEKVLRFISKVKDGIQSIGGKVGKAVSSVSAFTGDLFSKITPFADGGI